MTAIHFRWVFLAIGLGLFIESYATDSRTIGASAEWVNGNYRFAGGTDPWALVIAVGLIGLYILLMCTAAGDMGQPVPGVFRRFVAFSIDFVLAMMAMVPILGIVPTLMEWRRTGEFAWNFEREIFAAYDGWVSGIGVFVVFAGLAFYNAWPIVHGKPSPGSCAMGYRVVADEGVTLSMRKVLLRTLLGFISVCTAYLAPFIFRDKKKGKFWLDQVFGTHAEGLV